MKSLSRKKFHRIIQLERLEDRTLPSSSAAVQAAYGEVPLSFESNQGQTDPRVNFLSRGGGYTLFLSPTQAVLSLAQPAKTGATTPAVQSDVVGMQLIGANPNAVPTGLDELTGQSNYFVGNDPSQWRTNVTTFSRVEYSGVYPGINLIYYGNQQHLEYDFQVEPGADPRAIQLAFTGIQGLELDGQGDLVLRAVNSDLVEQAPVLYQQNGGIHQSVEGRYAVEGPGQVGFYVGDYNRSEPLVIDPTLSYSTYLGGSGADFGAGIAVDAAGNAYITGYTSSIDYPTVNAIQSGLGGSSVSAFVTKLNPAGNAIVYSSYFGGYNSIGVSVAVNAEGNAYLMGIAGYNFPTTPGAFQTTWKGADNFVTELSSSGNSLVYSTLVGGSNRVYWWTYWPFASTNVTTYPGGIALDALGNAWFTSTTTSSDYPITANAAQKTRTGYTTTVVTELNAKGTRLLYSTYLGGSEGEYGQGIAVDARGDAYVIDITNSTDFPTTANAFQRTNKAPRGSVAVVKIDPTKSGLASLVYSTYLGGSLEDDGIAIAVDSSGDAYVTGLTASSDFPVTPGAFQTTKGGGYYNAFVAELNAAGSGLIYATYLGGTEPSTTVGGNPGQDTSDAGGIGIAVASDGTAYVVGVASTSTFPTANATQAAFGGGDTDAFVAQLNATGSSLVYSSYLGGSGSDYADGVALDKAGNVYIVGTTSSTNLSTDDPLQSNNAGSYDAFVTKFAAPATAIQDKGGNANYLIQLKSGDPNTLRVLKNGTLLQSYSILVSNIVFDLTGGNNRLTVDYTNGDPIPAGGLLYEGGPDNALAVSAAADTGSRTITLDTVASAHGLFGTIAGEMGGVISYNCADTNNMTITTGDGTDVINVLSTGTAVTVLGNGKAHDTFNVGSSTHTLDAIRGGLTLDGHNSNSSTVNVNDQGSTTSQNFALSAALLTRSGGVSIAFVSMYSLTIRGGSDGNSFTVLALPTTTTLDLGSGNNTLKGPNTTNTWTITAANRGTLDGKITFSDADNLVGGTGSDSFEFSGASPAISGGVAGGGGADKLDYSRFTAGTIALDLQTGAASLIDGGAANGFIGISSLTGSAGSGNSLTGTDTTNTWTITGINSGKANSFSFTGVQKLIGGAGVDTFKFSVGGQETSIDGGGAPSGQGDWLDYSAFTSAVTVNLATGSATNVNSGASGAVANIQDVISGSGLASLTGDSQGNILIGHGGADTIAGGSGRSLLLGGTGASTVNGGSGGDILIGGRTVYDTTNQLALMIILAEWQSADSYTARTNEISHGTIAGHAAIKLFTPGTVYLNPTTTVGTLNALASTTELD